MIDREKGPLRGDKSESVIQDPGALLQTWLYFGMLHDVLSISGLQFDTENFVHSIDGEPAVTSLPLRGYLDRIAEAAEGMQIEERQRRQERVRECTRTVFG